MKGSDSAVGGSIRAGAERIAGRRSVGVLPEGARRYTAFMRTPQEAVSIILARARGEHETETVPLFEAAGRVLGADVASDIDIPPFHKSAMDGFAVRHADFGAPPGAGPVRLRLLGE